MRKIILFYFLYFFFIYPLFGYANSEYKELRTSQGKVIIGLDRKEALEKFGFPAAVTGDLWRYSTPEIFFIYFSPTSLLSIHLYPQFCEATVDVPLELKAFGYFSDFKIKDITSSVQFLTEEMQDFVFQKADVIIPQRTGNYQILTKYKDIFSNPAYLTIKESGEAKEEQEKEKLLSIIVLPHRPIIPFDGRSVDLIALGTFLDYSQDKYFIRDISQEVVWFIQKEEQVNKIRNNRINFSSLGKFTVFCNYKDIKSFPQEVEVRNILEPLKTTLKHITLLPEVIFVNTGKNINLRAFGTYYNNRVEDLTSKVKWDVDDKEILLTKGSGNFLANSVGITDVIAELDNLESLPVKIIVSSKKGSSIPNVFAKTKERKVNSKDLIKDIKGDMEVLSKSLLEKEKRLSLIKIIPDYLKLRLGENGQVTALGIYNDNSQEDLTLLGEWVNSDDKIAKVSKGKIETLSLGEIKIYVKFKGINSLPATVVVEGHKLVSITLSPQNSKIPMGGSLDLKAEGYFTDSSHKDITSLVDWKILNRGIIRIEKGKISPLRIGGTQVYAEYLGVKSLPVYIKVVITMRWLISMIIRIFSFLFSVIVMIFIILYFITETKKNKLRIYLDKNPRKFIVSLYDNVKKILAIFGLSYNECIPPLSYAELVEQKYSIESNLFLRFTVKFEEAKYSQHVLESNNAFLTLDDYNNFLRILFSRYNKVSIFLKYLVTLLHRKPLFISKISNPT